MRAIKSVLVVAGSSSLRALGKQVQCRNDTLAPFLRIGDG